MANKNLLGRRKKREENGESGGGQGREGGNVDIWKTASKLNISSASCKNDLRVVRMDLECYFCPQNS